VKASRIPWILIAALSATAFARLADADVWIEQKTTADDGTVNSQFGSAAALRGDTALIGADGDSTFQGAAYFFVKQDGAWTQGQKIVADDGSNGEEFGYRVALDDDFAVVSAFSASIGANTAQGAVYVFTPDGGSWSQSQQLLADDAATFDNFGASVAMDASTMVVGAIGASEFHGAAYIFKNAGGTWTQAQKIGADDGVPFDNFGIAAAIAGSVLFVSAPTAAVDGHNGQGAVYAFKLAGTTWTQTQKLVASDGAAFDGFGFSLAFDGTTLLVGATSSGGTGAVYAFTNDGGTWTEQQRLSADDGASGDSFGNAISLDGSRVLIGADIQTVDGDTSRGAAYLFTQANGSWTQSHKFVSSDGTTDDFFGLAVALEGATALISTLHPTIDGNSNQGAAYFYTNDTIFSDGFDE